MCVLISVVRSWSIGDCGSVGFRISSEWRVWHVRDWHNIKVRYRHGAFTKHFEQPPYDLPDVVPRSEGRSAPRLRWVKRQISVMLYRVISHR